jgi:putative oxidoreductase
MSRLTAIAVWFVRILVALAFIFFGIVKFPSDPQSVWVHVFARIGVGQWFRFVTGVIEMIGGFLLLFPRFTRLSVTMLAVTMVGALMTHVFIMGVGRQSVFVLVLIGALAIIAAGNRYIQRRKAASASVLEARHAGM